MALKVCLKSKYFWMLSDVITNIGYRLDGLRCRRSSCTRLNPSMDSQKLLDLFTPSVGGDLVYKSMVTNVISPSHVDLKNKLVGRSTVGVLKVYSSLVQTAHEFSLVFATA